MKPNQPTITDVANKARVSVSTVSRVMNDDPNVSEATKAQVNRAMKELDYRRIRKKAPEKHHMLNLIGVVVADICAPGLAPYISAIEEVAYRHGYNIILCDSKRDLAIERDNLDQLVAKGVEGLIIMPCSSSAPDILDELPADFTFVLLDRYLYGVDVPCVVSDNVYGAQQATKYLINLGHDQIVYIDGTKRSSIQRDRLEGYCSALRESGIPERAELIIDGEYDAETTYRAMLSLIDSGVSFTAVFASTDVMAFAAKQALEERGLKIPQDVSLVGYDDIELSRTIALTTVYHGAKEMGQAAITLLIDQIKGRAEKGGPIMLRPSLIIRETARRR